MLNTKFVGAVILAATAVSSTAMASDRGVNTAVGAIAGAALGHTVGGRNGAIVGGVLGAAVGNQAGRDRGYRDNRGGYASVQYSNGSGYYDHRNDGYYEERRPVRRSYRPAPVYVESRSYYEPAPVYYSAPPRYYAAPAVVYVAPRHRGHRGHGYGHGRGHGRGHGHGYR